MTKTTVTFEGLMVFHQDTAGFYELGILNGNLMGHHIPQHAFQIAITPDPRGGGPVWSRGPVELEQFLRQSDRWSLEVKDANGTVLQGINADESLPDRHNTNVSDKRFGWIVNLETSEFHNANLPRARGSFRPILRLSKGELYTYCKSGGTDVVQSNSSRDFGFLAGLLALDIDTSARESVALKLDGGGPDVFALGAGTSYRVDITNTAVTPSMASHFHAYYDMIFKTVPEDQRYDFAAQDDVHHPDECSPTRVLGPFPYRCGGLCLNKGGDPLS